MLNKKILVPASVANLASIANFTKPVFSTSGIFVEDELEKNERIDFQDLTIFLEDFDFLLNSHNFRFSLDKTLIEVSEDMGEAKASEIFSPKKFSDWCKNKNHHSYLRHAADLLDYEGNLPPKVEISDFVKQKDSIELIQLGMQLMYTDGLMNELKTFVRYLAYRYLLNQSINIISDIENTNMCKALNEIKYKDRIKKIIKIVDESVGASGMKNRKEIIKNPKSNKLVDARSKKNLK